MNIATGISNYSVLQKMSFNFNQEELVSPALDFFCFKLNFSCLIVLIFKLPYQI